ncbi:putative 2-aminoethylphosphonate ABC transporter ATP-binding protein [Parendozoicomonas haliclonae]|uniref:Sulfate/thiosulfate import ATP-binding protein CysA n=1 Tax=Parendozoicomonas haliclonae TaxID=1960125 RepID=A0A1X7AS76_9GAMM|nr:putative 2-aminoethylphosphonate ABC transporter ATP-binding protein [Parendozoicomonas haliclonae]SMA50287.1 Sulfate/thiosulfate import ATP-binding protein CysA [Parendozoicomonas haliclonae]
MSYLSISHLQKSFNDLLALNDISLEIEKGEFICFLGPSGCGKTTLLRTICGLESQDSGSIIQDSVDISRLSAEKRDFGIVFQSYALFPNLSVFDNIAFGLVNQRRPKQEITDKVNELLSLTGLQEHAQKYPSQLSGGQQQRVALCRALAMEPGLLLLDEPLSALDAKIREHLRREICRIHRKLGLTTIMVTHDQTEAMTMADRIVVMNAGRIEHVGTPEEIYLQPASAFVADFIGTSNTLYGEIKDTSLLLPGWTAPVALVEKRTGGETTILIRPEHLTLHNEQPSGPHAQGTISDIEFLGSQLSVELKLDDHQTQSNKALKATLSLQDAHHLTLTRNCPVWISVQPNNVCLLAEQEASAA